MDELPCLEQSWRHNGDHVCERFLGLSAQHHYQRHIPGFGVRHLRILASLRVHLGQPVCDRRSVADLGSTSWAMAQHDESLPDEYCGLVSRSMVGTPGEWRYQLRRLPMHVL